MSAFSQSVSEWLDVDGLVGSTPNPSNWSSGNPLLETSIACVMEVLLYGRASDVDFLRDRQKAILACRNLDGSFDKNPGRPDQITHDDLIAIACTQRPCGFKFASLIVQFGKTSNWVLSNTSAPYWDACVKPWDRAVYMMASGNLAAWYESISLAISIIWDVKHGDPSSHRIIWLLSISIFGLNPWVDMALDYWSKALRKKYPSVGALMLAYYKDQNHPYVVYGRQLTI